MMRHGARGTRGIGEDFWKSDLAPEVPDHWWQHIHETVEVNGVSSWIYTLSIGSLEAPDHVVHIFMDGEVARDTIGPIMEMARAILSVNLTWAFTEEVLLGRNRGMDKWTS